jgi:hypothetical protein
MAAQLPQRTNAASYHVVGRIVVGRNRRRDKPSGVFDDNAVDFMITHQSLRIAPWFRLTVSRCGRTFREK